MSFAVAIGADGGACSHQRMHTGSPAAVLHSGAAPVNLSAAVEWSLPAGSRLPADAADLLGATALH
jgi:hypothetical protein